MPWQAEVEQALESVKVAVLLLSAEFIASDFFAEDKLPALLTAAEEAGAIIMTVVVDALNSLPASLSRCRAINPSKPLAELNSEEQWEMLAKLAEAVGSALGYVPEEEERERLPLPDENVMTKILEAGGNAAAVQRASRLYSGVYRNIQQIDYYGHQNQVTRIHGENAPAYRTQERHRSLQPGTLLYGRYEIVKRIGGGGMGAVYYAKDKNLGDAPRAVKEMIQSHLDESQQEKAVADFRRESMLLASLEHPSIPTIYDYFFDETAAHFYLVMKIFGGGDFLARLRNTPSGRIDEWIVAEWGTQVVDVLKYLHNQRPPIIYRDLKPANLMIDGNNGRVMLIDFGIARWVAPQEKGVQAVGTMGYAPPELFSGRAEPRTDIYGLGATMFHLLMGSDPQDNPLHVFDFTKSPTPRQINPAISNEMEWILMRAVEYEPERRFRSAADMRDTLMQHVERLEAGTVTHGIIRNSSSLDVSTPAAEHVFCDYCGKPTDAGNIYCNHCGARRLTGHMRLGRAAGRLTVEGTTETDATFLLSKETNLIGRTDPASTIFPNVDLSRFDPERKISRRHARVWRDGDTFLVEDLYSSNGTIVNESIRLQPRIPRPLANGDRLRLGEMTLVFTVEEPKTDNVASGDS
jgi:serine/threonine protein kinase